MRPNPSLAGEGLGNDKGNRRDCPYSLNCPPSNLDVIRAELTGDSCSADDLTSRGHSPVLQLCRLMVAVGRDPALPLAVYRGHDLALTVASIGQGARLKVNSHGTAFTAFHRRRAASPMRRNGRTLTPDISE
jgi:hypothetical protein